MSDYNDPLHSVHTVVDEGHAFNARHPDLPDAAASFGALAWGMLRALYECPTCPGKYRVPTKDDANVIVCPNCCGVWTWQDAPPETAKRKRGRR
jgi:hypothetical protein